MDFQANEQPANPNIIGQLGGQPPQAETPESQQVLEGQSTAQAAGELAMSSTLPGTEGVLPTTIYPEPGSAEPTTTTTTSSISGRTITVSSTSQPLTTSSSMPNTMTTTKASLPTTSTSTAERHTKPVNLTTQSTTTALPPPPEVQAYREMFGSAMHPNDKN